jgi:hypothetical protein
LRVAYFVHDLSDAAVAKRVRMLQHAGAEVCVIGFRRSAVAPESVHGAQAFDLGRTFDGRLGQRVACVLRSGLARSRYRSAVAGADAILARNLEMLVLGDIVRRSCAPDARLAYECLDIHRAMLGDGLASSALRALERSLLKRTNLLLLSSPAHLYEYFERRQRLTRDIGAPVLLVENKVLDFDGAPPIPRRPEVPPWTIGWFGVLRCRKSLQLLLELARRNIGRLEVLIAGRPSEREFSDFSRCASALPNVTYRGPYRPDELPELYGKVHFTWAIDYFEEGANSAWLLPNRLYEGGLSGAVPIALRSTECGRWLQQRSLGVLVDDPVEDFGRLLDGGHFHELSRRSRTAPREWFAAGAADCEHLLQALASR